MKKKPEKMRIRTLHVPDNWTRETLTPHVVDLMTRGKTFPFYVLVRRSKWDSLDIFDVANAICVKHSLPGRFEYVGFHRKYAYKCREVTLADLM